MAYEFYEAYRQIKKTPVQQYKSDFQALLDSQFTNASDVYTIQEEVGLGTNSWQNLTVRITPAINNLTGEKLSDDWKMLLFDDLDHVFGIGYRYIFDSYYWIVINADYIKSIPSSALIRKCNWNLNWYNAGRSLVSEPSIVDYYDFTYQNNVADNKYMRTGEDIRYIVLQRNNNTILIKRDDRFIIDSRAYRVINYDSITRYGLYVLTMQEHQVDSVKDDVANNVADETVEEGGTKW